MEFIAEFFEKLRDIQALVAWAGYIGLFIIVFAETGLLIGFFLPGDSLLFTASLAAQGLFNIYELVVLLMIAAIVGDAVGYYIGKKSGHALYAREDSRFYEETSARDKKNSMISTECHDRCRQVDAVRTHIRPGGCRDRRDAVFHLPHIQRDRRNDLGVEHDPGRIFPWNSIPLHREASRTGDHRYRLPLDSGIIKYLR